MNRGGHHRGSPPGGYYAPYKNPKLENGPEGEYLPDRLTNETIAFIREHRKESFLAYLSFYTVHTPIQPCRRHVERFRKKRAALPAQDGEPQRREHDGWTKLRQDNAEYASMVYAMDENVGRLLAALDELKLSERTVIVFTSDNGGLSTLHRRGFPTSNLPLRAGKGWCYEGGIRVPFIVRAPGVTKAGFVSDVPVYSADIYPTVLELAGLPAAPQQHVDGKSVVSLLRGGKSLKRDSGIVWHFPHYHGSAWTPGSAIRVGSWKLIEFYDKEKVELYNLVDDPGESRDLSKQESERAADLRAKLREYLEKVDAPMPRANPKFGAAKEP